MVTLDEIRSAGIPESWDCIDCGMNTAPGCPNAIQVEQPFAHNGKARMAYDERSEVYTVKSAVWKDAGSAAGCLCVGCIEKRLGRPLRPKDFARQNELNQLPGTDRLLSRRMGMPQ